MKVTECFVRPIGSKAALTIYVNGTTEGEVRHDAPLATGDPAQLAAIFEDAAAWLRALQPAPQPVESPPQPQEAA